MRKNVLVLSSQTEDSVDKKTFHNVNCVEVTLISEKRHGAD